MEKVKSLCSKCGTWIKSHVAIVAIIVVVLIVAIVLVSFVSGSEKRAIKKYLSAINSCDAEKVIKAMDTEAAVAWNSAFYASGDDIIEDFEDALEDVDDDDIESYEDTLDEQYDKDDKGKIKRKLEKVIYVTKAKDNKDIKKVVCKVQKTIKPDDDDDDDDDNIWAKTKTFTRTTESYVTFYLYKNKVIMMSDY